MKENIISFFQYFFWKRKIKEVHTHSEDSVRRVFRSIAQNGFDYYGESVPYGRAKWFIESEQEFYNEFSNTEFEYFGYSPVRSLKEEDFTEYGLLLTQYGIFEKMQIKDQERCNVQFFPFSNLWKVEVDDNDQLAFYYPYGIIKRLNVSNSLNYVVRELNELIASGYTNDVQVENLNTQLLKIGKKNVNSTTFRRGSEIGIISWILLSVGDRLHKAQINAMVSAPSGHGHAAEYANNVIDRIKYPFQDVKQIGQNNAKNGADRQVGNQKIQTKYYARATGTVNSAFDSESGMYKYKGMQLEVPKDQYDKAVELFGEKIRQGKVEGVNNPEEAKNYIRKGHITYRESRLIAQGGNLTSIKFDAIDGAINSLPGVGISFVIVFSQAKWSGAETKDAALMAGKAGLRTLAMGTSIYVASQQFAKIFTKQINDFFGKKITAEVVARRAAPVISFAVIITPDIFDALLGRISSQQLLKNVAVAGGGMLAGAGAGAVGGAIAGPFGVAAGAIIGGIAGGFGVKLIADQFIEDDRVEMFAQLKEEFIDLVMVISLSQEEFNKIQEAVFNEHLEGLLKNMFQKKENSRNFAKEFVEEKIKSVIKDRKRVELKEIIEAVQVINDVQDSSESGWKQNDGAWYYLNNSSSLARGWIQDNEHWYYLSDDGVLVTGWFKYNDVWYYLKDNGSMATGWIQDSGKWYYLNEDGSMVTGWFQIGEKWYYLYSSGELAVSTTIDGYRVNENGECID
ncbi:cell wall binding repeat family protein [Streptococcus oralis]|jgi:choline binding protein pcpA|uniref:N-acetylmuramoyl-L-alanine amidase family protein n=1 Tax=Streptococcus TaxID=1301 RepID=UPI001904E14E|nr:N-acetylmuramoyl-L-alanine amidase family protein [Streptococcus oralis]QQK99722.1 N-acetylmuramoyl-L-alanine amidase family protein [Streptococcus oralis]QRO07447.1 cell wall binding repeat family protein [Streptococcus oralis]